MLDGRHGDDGGAAGRGRGRAGPDHRRDRDRRLGRRPARRADRAGTVRSAGLTRPAAAHRPDRAEQRDADQRVAHGQPGDAEPGLLVGVVEQALHHQPGHEHDGPQQAGQRVGAQQPGIARASRARAPLMPCQITPASGQRTSTETRKAEREHRAVDQAGQVEAAGLAGPVGDERGDADAEQPGHRRLQRLLADDPPDRDQRRRPRAPRSARAAARTAGWPRRTRRPGSTRRRCPGRPPICSSRVGELALGGLDVPASDPARRIAAGSDGGGPAVTGPDRSRRTGCRAPCGPPGAASRPRTRMVRPGSMPGMRRRPSQISVTPSVPSNSSASSDASASWGQNSTLRSLPNTVTSWPQAHSAARWAPDRSASSDRSSASSSSTSLVSRRNMRRNAPPSVLLI